jgi:hypothetical protein
VFTSCAPDSGISLYPAKRGLWRRTLTTDKRSSSCNRSDRRDLELTSKGECPWAERRLVKRAGLRCQRLARLKIGLNASPRPEASLLLDYRAKTSHVSRVAASRPTVPQIGIAGIPEWMLHKT